MARHNGIVWQRDKMARIRRGMELVVVSQGVPLGNSCVGPFFVAGAMHGRETYIQSNPCWAREVWR